VVSAAKIEDTNSIADTLHRLIKQKSVKDGVTFTPYQLANALNIKRSILHRLMHSDPEQRVTNPRVETLLKIVKFFRKDGFNSSLDDFLGLSDRVNVREHEISPLKNMLTLPVFSINNPTNHALGSVTLKATSHSNALIALELQEVIPPIFEKGSVLIIDTEAQPCDNNLVAVITDESPAASILRYRVVDQQVTLEPIVTDEQHEQMLMNADHHILGVIIQINTKL